MIKKIQRCEALACKNPQVRDSYFCKHHHGFLSAEQREQVAISVNDVMSEKKRCSVKERAIADIAAREITSLKERCGWYITEAVGVYDGQIKVGLAFTNNGIERSSFAVSPTFYKSLHQAYAKLRPQWDRVSRTDHKPHSIFPKVQTNQRDLQWQKAEELLFGGES